MLKYSIEYMKRDFLQKQNRQNNRKTINTTQEDQQEHHQKDGLINGDPSLREKATLKKQKQVYNWPKASKDEEE